MQYDANSPDEYIALIPDERRAIMKELRKTIKESLPRGFEEGMNYKMIGYYVPHSIYPDGYHCDTSQPLPFMNIASQKNSINLYHSGIYADENLHNWFVSEYPKHSKRKLDMGKSCIRFKKIDEIPLALIAELCTNMSVKEWVVLYESNVKR